MPVIGRVTVENPDEILNAGAYGAGAIIRVQTSATQAGAFADISGAGSTPTVPIVTAVRAYTFYDPNGTTSSWYRTRYENAGATRLSDWSAPFQTGDETAGLLCSLYDIKQRIGTTSVTDDELLIDFIRQVSSEIRGYTRKTFAPDPVTGTVVRLYDGYEAANGGMRVQVPEGIISLSSVEVAQYTTGSYLTIPAGQWFLRPMPQHRVNAEPATEVWMTDFPTSGSIFYIYRGFENVRLTGQFGWPAVPDDIQGVAQNAVLKRYIGKETAAPAVSIGPSGAITLLRGFSPDDMRVLMRYRDPVAA